RLRRPPLRPPPRPPFLEYPHSLEKTCLSPAPYWNPPLYVRTTPNKDSCRWGACGLRFALSVTTYRPDGTQPLNQGATAAPVVFDESVEKAGQTLIPTTTILPQDAEVALRSRLWNWKSPRGLSCGLY